MRLRNSPTAGAWPVFGQFGGLEVAPARVAVPSARAQPSATASDADSRGWRKRNTGTSCGGLDKELMKPGRRPRQRVPLSIRSRKEKRNFVRLDARARCGTAHGARHHFSHRLDDEAG